MWLQKKHVWLFRNLVCRQNQEGRGVETKLTDITETLSKSQCVAALFTDLMKAFDAAHNAETENQEYWVFWLTGVIMIFLVKTARAGRWFHFQVSYC